MGKLDPPRRSKSRHSPLERDLARDRVIPDSQHRRRSPGGQIEEDDGAAFLTGKESAALLRQAKRQRDDMAREEELQLREDVMAGAMEAQGDDEEEEEEEVWVTNEDVEDLIEVQDGEYVEAGGVLSAAEERLVASFMDQAAAAGEDEEAEAGAGGPRLLADIIMEKLRLQELQAQHAEEAGAAPEIPAKVMEVYTEIGKILQHWGRVRVPKAFKIIPHLTNWEEILYLTRPDEWSPHSWFVATRLFASNLNEPMAQHFYAAFLLPRCLEDIQQHKRLNYHLYASLQKAVYKPAAWVKGILLPLAQTQVVTLREAAIVGSVLAKTSLPMQHGAAALLKLSGTKYNGTNSLFVRILLQKKYALPHRVIDALVVHFCAFKDEARQLPVLWHQALLAFAQRYKADISPAQKQQLKTLMRAQSHHLITVEVRRELFQA